MRDHMEDPVAGDDAMGQDHYYLLKELYTVAGLVSRNGAAEEYYVYDTYGDATLYEWPIGDVNRDGTVNNVDWTFVSNAASDTGKPYFDIDLDGDIDSADATETTNHNGETAIEVTYSSVDNPYFFTGRITDTLHADDLLVSEDANFKRLQDNRRRIYDPKHGRWLQRDPAKYVDGMNLYEYVQGRPVSLTDPSGLAVKWIGSDAVGIDVGVLNISASLFGVAGFSGTLGVQVLANCTSKPRSISAYAYFGVGFYFGSFGLPVSVTGTFGANAVWNTPTPQAYTKTFYELQVGGGIAGAGLYASIFTASPPNWSVASGGVSFGTQFGFFSPGVSAYLQRQHFWLFGTFSMSRQYQRWLCCPGGGGGTPIPGTVSEVREAHENWGRVCMRAKVGALEEGRALAKQLKPLILSEYRRSLPLAVRTFLMLANETVREDWRDSWEDTEWRIDLGGQ